MNVYKALLFLEGYTASHASPLTNNAIATLRVCVDACESAEQTLRNLATGFLTGDGAEIACNEAGNLHNVLKGE